jgi:hypothetical protein
LRYQETWIKGCPTGEAFQRECASRYEPIKAVLGEYKRPFSVFDFGANMGYFTFRIAEDFPQATVIAVDNRTGKAMPARSSAGIMALSDPVSVRQAMKSIGPRPTPRKGLSGSCTALPGPHRSN